MTLNCSLLSNFITDGPPINGTTDNQMWLETDYTFLFAEKYWTSEFALSIISMFICSMIILSGISSCCVYYKYHKYEKNHKLLYLKERGVKAIFGAEIKPYLECYVTDLNIITIIFEYAAINNNDINSIMTLNMSSVTTSFCIMEWAIMAICILLTSSYLLIYHVSIHWIDSNKSYIDIQCSSIGRGACAVSDPYDKPECPLYNYQYKMDMDSACIDNTYSDDMQNYTFYSEFPAGPNEPCFINRNNFNVRGRSNKGFAIKGEDTGGAGCICMSDDAYCGWICFSFVLLIIGMALIYIFAVCVMSGEICSMFDYEIKMN